MLTAQITYLSSQLLMVLQQRDAEGLARFRSTLEIQLLTTIAQVKADAVTEVDSTLITTPSLLLTRPKALATARQDYYGSRNYMNAWEWTHFAGRDSKSARRGQVSLNAAFSARKQR